MAGSRKTPAPMALSISAMEGCLEFLLCLLLGCFSLWGAVDWEEEEEGVFNLGREGEVLGMECEVLLLCPAEARI